MVLRVVKSFGEAYLLHGWVEKCSCNVLSRGVLVGDKCQNLLLGLSCAMYIMYYYNQPYKLNVFLMFAYLLAHVL